MQAETKSPRLRGLAVVATLAACSATLPAVYAGVTEPDPGPSKPADAGTSCADDLAAPSLDAGDGAPDAGDGDDASGPALAGLDVTASGRDGSILIPAFAPGTHDYYVVCVENQASLTVSITPAAGTTVELAVETPASPQGTLRGYGAIDAKKDVPLPVAEGQAVVVTVNDAAKDASPEEYWIRCMPYDAPPMVWVDRAPQERRPPGYYLVGDVTPTSKPDLFALILDTNGVPVWYDRVLRGSPIEANSTPFDVDSVVSGAVSFIAWPSVETSWPFELKHLDPVSTAGIGPPGWTMDPHELRALANGDYLAFAFQTEEGVDLTGYNVALPDGGVDSLGPDSTILACDILEFDAQNRVVWEWVATDHLDAVKDNVLPGVETISDGRVLPDPFHCNSIDVDPETGDLLVSARHLDSVFYVERSTGKILWKMGGVNYTKDQAAFIPVASPFRLQHDARLVPGWSPTCGGQVTVFDDESYTKNPSRAVVYDVALGGGGCSNGETPGASVAWVVYGTVASASMGSLRFEPGGTRVVDWGTGGEAALVFTEFDVKGDRLLDFYFPPNGASYRTVKLPPCALDLNVLRRTAGLP